MALEIKLNQKLSQSLVMTPQLQQAIKLLQLGRVEYLEMLEKELLENPVLEDENLSEDQIENDGNGSLAEALSRDPDGTSISASRSGEEAAKELTGSEPAEFNEELLGESFFDEFSHKLSASSLDESDWTEYLDTVFETFSSSATGTGRYNEDDDRPSFESTVSKPEGLAAHILWQLRTVELPQDDQEIALQIVGNIDRNGYLRLSLDDVAKACNRCLADAEQVLAIVQTLDPPGVGARDLRECLCIQLEQLGLSNSLAYQIVANHLEKLELKKYDVIAREESTTIDNVYEAVKIIQKLEPRPGRPFIDEPPIYVTPDIYVRKVGDDYIISLNEAGMPKLRLNPRYRELLDNNGDNVDVPNKEYLQDRLRSAAWLIKSIHQRQQTIFRVTESIMKYQREFLDRGVTALRPLVLRDIASDVSMHESTVSRVTTNKYVHTPQGIYELKFFFSSGLRTGQGEISSESVKEKIRALIAAEDPRKPLSDQAIVEYLKAEGINIARRTVAKYREMLSILSSSRRKKVF